MKQCVLCVLGMLVCLAAQGLSTGPESSLKDLENELENNLKSAVDKVVSYIKKCDCFIRLDVLKARLDWYCSATSDYECESMILHDLTCVCREKDWRFIYIPSLYLGQSLSLEELQDLVQTQAETEGWEKKRLELLGKCTVAFRPALPVVSWVSKKPLV